MNFVLAVMRLIDNFQVLAIGIDFVSAGVCHVRKMGRLYAIVIINC